MNHSRLQATAMVDLQHPECILQQGLHPRKVKVTSTHALHPRMVHLPKPSIPGGSYQSSAAQGKVPTMTTLKM